MSSLLDEDISPQSEVRKPTSSIKPFPFGKERYLIGFQVLIILVVAFSIAKDKWIFSVFKSWPLIYYRPMPTGHYTIYRQDDGTGMVLVPGGYFIMGSSIKKVDLYVMPMQAVHLDGFWIDQTEVTIDMFRRFVEATGYKTDADLAGKTPINKPANGDFIEGANWEHPLGPGNSLEGSDTFPVNQVSWNDARAYCNWRGKRLPTEAEWTKAARGTDARSFPWGNKQPTAEYLNIKGVADGYIHAAPVGSYPKGVSPYGALDMAGNVSEWVEDSLYDGSQLDSNLGNLPISRNALGSSWNTDLNYLFSYGRGSKYRATWYEDIGFRCAISQTDFEQLRSFTNSAYIPNDTLIPSETLTPTQIVTVTLSPTPNPTNTQTPTITLTQTPMTTKVSKKDAMVQIWVPEGEFQMGISDEQIKKLLSENIDWQRDWFKADQPAHTVYLDGFWMDRTEVTNWMYSLCVAAGGCLTPPIPYLASANSSDGIYSGYPVIPVNWFQAKEYCKWAGRRLPTEAEWEKAARGTDGRMYPWGDDLDCKRANYHRCIGNPSPVGSLPAGSSPYGILDMAGNVWEWVADWYSETYYSNTPLRNPLGPVNGEFRVIRGGSANASAIYTLGSYRYSYNPQWGGYGFRCAQSK